MLINWSYALMHVVVLFRLFPDWEFALGFGAYFYSIGRAFEHIREKHGLVTDLMAHYGMSAASSGVMILIFEL